MPTEGTDNNKATVSVLADDEPQSYKVLNPKSESPVLLVCDHASRRFPRSLGSMGLDPFARRCHLAIDIGAGPLTERLSERLGVTAVLARYSRLIVDCNRELMDPGAYLEYGDGIIVPGNRNLSQSHKDARAAEIYWPYHYAVETEIQRLSEGECPPSLIAVHSFTPVLNGISRAWQIGILSDTDRRIAEIMLSEFRAEGYLVGDNEPYSGKAPQDFTIDHHAEAAGLPHVGIEIRQDLIDDEAGVKEIADILQRIIATIPAKLYATDIKTGEKIIPA
jgi:predicted N-formylglutamate amidohydrolase